MTGSRPPGRRALLAGTVVLGSAAVLFALHAAATRRLLTTPTLRRLLNTRPETSRIDWDEAISVVPGRVRVRGFRLYGNDGNVEWTLRLEEARLTYSLFELAARRFHVTELAGRGLTFRVHPATREARRVAARAPAPSGKTPWTVRVDGIAVDPVDEIAIAPYRFSGRARLAGRFRLTPGRAAEVGSARIDLDAGKISLGRNPMLSLETGGRIAARIDPWDPRLLPGGEVWRRASGDVRLAGRVPGFEFFDHYTEGGALRLSGGAGRARIEGDVRDGVVSARLRVSAKKLRATIGEAKLSGDADVTVRLARWRVESGTAALDGSQLALSNVASEPDQSQAWWGNFRFPRGRLRPAFEASVEGESRDARPLISIVGSGLPKWARRALSLEELRVSAGVEASPRHLAVRELDARSRSLHLEGDYRRIGDREDGVFLIDAGKVNVGLTLHGGKTHVRPIATRHWLERARTALSADASGSDAQARSTMTAVP